VRKEKSNFFDRKKERKGVEVSGRGGNGDGIDPNQGGRLADAEGGRDASLRTNQKETCSCRAGNGRRKKKTSVVNGLAWGKEKGKSVDEIASVG